MNAKQEIWTGLFMSTAQPKPVFAVFSGKFGAVSRSVSRFRACLIYAREMHLQICGLPEAPDEHRTQAQMDRGD